MYIIKVIDHTAERPGERQSICEVNAQCELSL